MTPWVLSTIILLILWLAVVIKNTAYYTWLWQLKEYRWDRLRSSLQEKPKKKWVKNWLGWLKLFLIASVFLPLISPAWHEIMGFIVIFLFGYELWRAQKLFRKKQLKKPDLTLKALIIGSSVFFAVIGLGFYLIYYAKPLTFNLISKAGFNWISWWLLVAERTIAPIVALITIILKAPTKLWKMLKINQAKQKIALQKKLIKIGITGSFGKSSTKEFLSQILTSKFIVLKTPKNINTDVGIAKLILNKLTPKTEVFIGEMGAYKKGEIRKIASIVKPQMGILTGISLQHVSLFGSLKNIKQAKFELIASLPENGIAFFNGENKHCLQLAQKTKAESFFYGRKKTKSNNLDFWAEEVKVHPKKTTFTIHNPKNSHKATLNFPGEHYITNFLGAAACAYKLGIDLKEIANFASHLKPPHQAMTCKKGYKNNFVINDTYSANPDGVMAALKYLQKAHPQKRKLVIIRTLIELGGEAVKIHQKLGEKIGKLCQKLFITTEEFSKSLRKGALDGGMTGNDIFIISDADRMIKILRKNIKKDDVILIEGRVNQKIKDFVLQDSNQ